jgi:hypothetical protein
LSFISILLVLPAWVPSVSFVATDTRTYRDFCDVSVAVDATITFEILVAARATVVARASYGVGLCLLGKHTDASGATSSTLIGLHTPDLLVF